MTPDPVRLAPVLWALLALFVARVAGQALVAFLGVAWLPPMDQWYSGLLAYRYLLPAQLLIVVLYASICRDFSRGRGFFVRRNRWLGRPVLWFGYIYLAVMVIRLPLQHLLSPAARWFDGIIPVVFHWVLASFLIIVARFHDRLRHDTGR